VTFVGSKAHTGATSVQAGTVIVQNNQALGTGAGNTSVSAGAAVALEGGVNVAEAFSLTGSGVGGSGALRNSSGNNLVTGAVTQTGASKIRSEAGTLTFDVASGDAVSGGFLLAVDGAGNTVFNDRVNLAGAGFTKEGTGTVTLAETALNNDLGTVNVDAGTMIINGTTTGGALNVAAGATLKGKGTVGGNTAISRSHRPGLSPEIQSFTNLTYNNGASVEWELISNSLTTRGSQFDGINVSGNLTVNPVVTTRPEPRSRQRAPERYSRLNIADRMCS
jgi:hypothetical protein